MSMGKRHAVGGAEVDAFSRIRRIVKWGRGERQWIKTRARRRERRQAKQRRHE